MSSSWLELEGKVAIVTGGASGIGLHIAKGLVNNGAKVVVSDINGEEGQQAATYAFGDGLNDLEMFELVHHPIAMGNALDIVKQSAKHVTHSHDEDGILKGLQLCGLLK